MEPAGSTRLALLRLAPKGAGNLPLKGALGSLLQLLQSFREHLGDTPSRAEVLGDPGVPEVSLRTVPDRIVAVRRAAYWLAITCSLFQISAELWAENIILISVDTLRADRLSCYGYGKNRTPNIDRWAEEGVLFDRAYTEYPLTLPAHYTMLTGIYPCSHGAKENVGYRLEAERETIAEVLGRSGFKTGGFIGAYVLASEFGINQGFDVFDEDFATSVEKVAAATQVQRPAEQVTERFLAWLDRRKEEQIFAFVHYYDPHTPRPLGYDREVSNVDRNIGKIDSFLRENGLLEKTHIFLTSDHGEGLGEHGESGHGFFLYDSTIRIPLIFRPAAGYDVTSRRVSAAVSLADLMPTVLHLSGVEIPEDVQGRNLVPLLRGQTLRREGVYAETFIPQLHFGWASLRSFRLRGFKYIEAPSPELYEIGPDPGETQDLSSSRSDLGGAYRSQLGEFVTKFGDSLGGSSQRDVDRQARERLAALGYVSLQQQRSFASTAGSIDPKDRIQAFEDYHGVLNDLSNRVVKPSTLTRIERIQITAPEVKGVSFLKAWYFELADNPSEAEIHYRKALREAPDQVLARARFARLLERGGRLDEAEREMREVLRISPSDYKTRNNLAGVYFKTGRTDAALAEMRTITKERPRYGAAWQNLGLLCMGMNKWAEAEDAFRRVIELDDGNAIAHFNLARVLRELGRPEEAEKAMEIALKLDPRLGRR
jgi:arylsulfatase A-like enzyme/Flp pilus assembly protein TadD